MFPLKLFLETTLNSAGSENLGTRQPKALSG